MLSNATWAWNGSNWAKLAPATVPAARATAAIGYDNATAQLVMFGGDGSQGFLGDTWIWNGSNWVQKMPPSQPWPSWRSVADL